jgi:hypothetical protein
MSAHVRIEVDELFEKSIMFQKPQHFSRWGMICEISEGSYKSITLSI